MTPTKVFLVDDDSDDTELFAEAVESVDAQVSFENATHGKEALDVLTSNISDKPDVIFLDVNMPVMDGWQFLTKIKETESLKEIPVIMYSTSSKRSDFYTALSSGALCFVTKPDSFSRLKKIVQIVINYMTLGNLDEVCDAISKA